MSTILEVVYQPLGQINVEDSSTEITLELTLATVGPPGPQGPAGLTTIGTLEDLTDVDTMAKQPGQFLYYDGSEWTSAPLDGGTFN